MTPRLKKSNGKTREIMTGCGKILLTVSEGDKEITILISSHGKKGTCMASNVETISRLIGMGCEDKETYKKNIHRIIKALKGNGCSRSTANVKSCSDGIAQLLESFIKEHE